MSLFVTAGATAVGDSKGVHSRQLELELRPSHMTQKRMLRGEVHAPALRVYAGYSVISLILLSWFDSRFSVAPRCE